MVIERHGERSAGHKSLFPLHTFARGPFYFVMFEREKCYVL